MLWNPFANIRRLLRRNHEAIMAALDQLTQEVEETKTVMESAAVLLSGLKEKLDEAIAANQAGDLTKLTELSESLDSAQAELAAAITANTPEEE